MWKHLFFKTLSSIAVVIALSVCLVPASAKAEELNVDTDVAVYVSHDISERVIPFSQRSWYGESINFLSQQILGDYYFDGNSVGLELTASSASNGVFSVSLYRVSSGVRFIGSIDFKRNGFTKGTWSNVGSGTYRFVLTKPADGFWVTSSDVALYSW